MLDDDALALLLLRAPSAAALQALCITSRRLRDAITAESFQVNRIRMGFAATDVWIDDRDEDDLPEEEEEDEDDLGTQGDDRCLRHFGGCIFLDGVTAGRFQCALIDRMQCYHGKFLSVCDAESQELIDIGRCLFDEQGLPRYAALKADSAVDYTTCEASSGFLYISKFELTPAPKGRGVPAAAALAALASLAIKKLLSLEQLGERWVAAAYIGDGSLSTYETSVPTLVADDSAFRRRRIADCRPFVAASFDEIERSGDKDGGWLFTTLKRLRDGTVRSTPLRAEAPPDPLCSAEPAGLDKKLFEAVIKSGGQIGAATAAAATAGVAAGGAAAITACMDGLLGNVRAFIAAGASLDNSHALHAAAFLGQPALVAGLVQLGASVDARDRTGFTPLMIAAQKVSSKYHPVHNPHDDTACVDMLLSLGADKSLVGPDGCSALGCYRQAQRNTDDFLATFGMQGLRRGTNLPVEAKLTPPAGPTAADANAALASGGGGAEAAAEAEDDY
jgi:hypothetical protein